MSSLILCISLDSEGETWRHFSRSLLVKGKNSVAPDRRLVFRGHFLHVICYGEVPRNSVAKSDKSGTSSIHFTISGVKNAMAFVGYKFVLHYAG